MMTDENQIDHDVELDDDENEIMEAQGHDPKNAEAQSVASVDKAAAATGSAPKRKGDNTKQEPMAKMPGTKAGMINVAYGKMNNMTKEQLSSLVTKMMAEGIDVEDEAVFETAELDYEADFSDDLNAIMADEATLSEEFKEKTAVIFEAAIKSKLVEEVNRLEEKYHEELAEEIESTKSDLVEKVDSYLHYVVEQWLETNKLAVQTGLRTEIAETFMNNLKDLFTESYIEVPESKVDLVDDLAEQVEELETQLNSTTADAIEMAEELENYKRDAVIAEAARGLADTQAEKLKSLVADMDFDDEETFASKVATVKESYFPKTTKNVNESTDFESDDEDDTVEVSGSMAQYLTALNRTSKKL
jgi:hypothetical protein